MIIIDKLKQFGNWIKRKWKALVLVVVGGTVIAAIQAPPDLIEYQNKWIGSYETLGFDTLDGDLDFGQYALTEDGEGYYIRTKPKDEAQFERVGLDYDVSKLKEVKIKGHAYYHEFRKADGVTKRVQTDYDGYWNLSRIKKYPQPKRIEMVEEIPYFPEDEQLKSEHHSIGLDATSNSGVKSSISSYSWSHTCTGDNRLLVVGDGNYGIYVPATASVTYNAVDLTPIGNKKEDWVRISLFYLIAPATGSNTVAVTLSGTVDNALGGAISYTGADQSNQPDASNSASGGAGSSLTATVDVTTQVDNCWVVSIVKVGGGLTCGNTERWNETIATYYDIGGSDTGGPKTPAGNQTMSWTQSAKYSWLIFAASFAPAAAPPPAAEEPVQSEWWFD